MSLQQLPKELEIYLIKTFFHYSDTYYLSPVCKKWRDINNNITELKIFFKKLFECCLLYPYSNGEGGCEDSIGSMELFNNKKRNWNNESLLHYRRIKYHCHGRWGDEEKKEKLRNYKYNTGRFNDHDLIRTAQDYHRPMIQMTYIPDTMNFTCHFIDNLLCMEKKLNEIKKECLKDKKNQGFKIKFHKRQNGIKDSMSLIIWQTK